MVNAMKDDFLTIPDAPNYEINSQLMVRNKKTGRLLKIRQDDYKNKKGYYCLCIKGKPKSYKAETLRLLAVEFNSARLGEKWVKIPSLNYLYEMTPNGTLRNAKTKRITKKYLIGKQFYYHLSINRKAVNRSLKKLLWETHGEIYIGRHKIAVTLTKNNQIYNFDSLAAAGRFLTNRVHYAFSTISSFFTKRIAEICGWHITYHEENNLYDL